MKNGLYTSFLALALVPVSAHAADSTLSFTVGASSRYVFETQASVLSKNPVVNVEVDWQQSKNFSGYVWVQGGDRDGREIDIGENVNFDLGRGVRAHASAAVYLYPDGFDPIYTASIGISIPVHGFTLDLDAQRYEGGFKSTKLAVSVSHPVKIGPVDVTVTVGKAHNTGDIDGVNPWFGRISLPLGKDDHALVLGLRGFVGAGHGSVVDLTYSF